MRARNLLFAISLLGNALLITYHFYNRDRANERKLKSNNQRDESRATVLKLLPVDSSSTVFIGTSLTEGFPVAQMFRDLKMVNMGIGGAEAHHVSARAEWVLAKKPKKMFVEMGINDITLSHSTEQIIDNYRDIILAGRKSNTQIYFTSIFPTTREDRKYNKRIVECNRKIKALADSCGVPYLNIHPMMEDNGELRSDFTMDGIHLTGAAYLVWKAAIDSLVH